MSLDITFTLSTCRLNGTVYDALSYWDPDVVSSIYTSWCLVRTTSMVLPLRGPRPPRGIPICISKQNTCCPPRKPVLSTATSSNWPISTRCWSRLTSRGDARCCRFHMRAPELPEGKAITSSEYSCQMYYNNQLCAQDTFKDGVLFFLVQRYGG